MSTVEAAPELAPESGPGLGPESALGWGPGAAHPVLAELASVRAALGRVGACPGWSMSDAEVITALEGLLAARAELEALTATQVAVAEARGLRAALNQSSTARWLRRRFRVSGGEAGRLHTLAPGLRRWEATAAALAAGQVGTEQAAAITQVMDALPAGTSAEARGQAEVLLLDQAATLDPGELAACGRALIERLTTVPDSDDPDEEARLVEADGFHTLECPGPHRPATPRRRSRSLRTVHGPACRHHGSTRARVAGWLAR